MLYIHPDECVDCGACEPVCPVEAIFYEDDVPEQWSHYTDQRRFLRRVGIAGRCGQGVGMTENDPQAASRIWRCRARTPEPAGGSNLLAAECRRLCPSSLGHLADAKALAGAHPMVPVDLPSALVDPVAPLIQRRWRRPVPPLAIRATAGTARLRESVVAALVRRYGITRLTEAAVLPVIGTR